MGPRKTVTESSDEAGYPGFLYGLCKEEDVLIIPQFVIHPRDGQAESASPRARTSTQQESLSQVLQRSKESKASQRLESMESRGEDLLICGSLRPPQVGIAYANPDDKDSPVAVVCKSIYIEYTFITALGKSFKPYPTIASLKIEDCCISKEIAEALAVLLAEDSGKWISDVSLEGNEGIAEVLPLFLKLPNGVRYLSLARCSLDDDDVALLAESLGFTDAKEQKLQYLNLSMNKIGDAGVSCLAESLRTNRSLISLSLAGNRIGDEGVARLTEVLQKFPLTWDEVMMKRKRIFDTIFRKKNAVDKYVEERKAKEESDDNNSTNNNNNNNNNNDNDNNQPRKTHTKSMGRKIRWPDGRIQCLPSRDSKMKNGMPKTTSGEKFRGKSRPEEASSNVELTASEIFEIVQQVESEMPPDKHPFVNEVQYDDHCAWVNGCWSLGNINLAYNYLTDESAKMFLDVLNFQNANYSHKMGLLRLLLLPGNLFKENCPEFQKLLTALIYRNSKKEVPENSDPPTGDPSLRKASSAKLSKK